LREQSEEAIRSSSNDPKNLTRRANHRQMFNIARILEPAPGNWSRAFQSSRAFAHCEEQSEQAIRSSPNDPEKI
jgi:hypothetical protein